METLNINGFRLPAFQAIALCTWEIGPALDVFGAAQVDEKPCTQHDTRALGTAAINLIDTAAEFNGFGRSEETRKWSGGGGGKGPWRGRAPPSAP